MGCRSGDGRGKRDVRRVTDMAWKQNRWKNKVDSDCDRKELFSTTLLDLRGTQWNHVLPVCEVLRTITLSSNRKFSYEWCKWHIEQCLPVRQPAGYSVSFQRSSQSEHRFECMSQLYSVCSPRTCLELNTLPWEILFNLYLYCMLLHFGYLILNDVKFISLNLLNQIMTVSTLIFHFCSFSFSLQTLHSWLMAISLIWMC